MYRYRITPHSPFATPMRSDTLYGHLLCVVREWDGDKAADDMIAAFANGRPPFRLSSVFPRGMLPMPVLPAASREEIRTSTQDLLDTLQKLKKFKKLAWLPVSAWKEHCEHLSQQSLFVSWLTNPQAFVPALESRQCYSPHNSISRVSGSVLDQEGFYFDNAEFFGASTELDLYVESDDIAFVETLFHRLGQTGFGKDKTTGKGQFGFCQDSGFRADEFNVPGDSYLNLSVYSAQDLKGIQGSYKLFTKYGKVWNGFGQTNPYKKPFLTFSEGSVFYGELPESYVLRGIHADPDIVQVVCPLLLPCRIGGEND